MITVLRNHASLPLNRFLDKGVLNGHFAFLNAYFAFVPLLQLEVVLPNLCVVLVFTPYPEHILPIAGVRWKRVSNRDGLIGLKFVNVPVLLTPYHQVLEPGAVYVCYLFLNIFDFRELTSLLLLEV